MAEERESTQNLLQQSFLLPGALAEDAQTYNFEWLRQDDRAEFQTRLANLDRLARLDMIFKSDPLMKDLAERGRLDSSSDESDDSDDSDSDRLDSCSDDSDLDNSSDDCDWCKTACDTRQAEPQAEPIPDSAHAAG